MEKYDARSRFDLNVQVWRIWSCKQCQAEHEVAELSVLHGSLDFGTQSIEC